MPLPANGSLSLQGHSRPGDAVHSKPKQAMLVRMSAETLEALSNFQNQPQMDFEFGDNPGIYIGETFFPMRTRLENVPHDLYLRASSAAKPMAPLKLYANVMGKFTVERDLSTVTSKVRESAADAANQRSQRQLIVLDAPPPEVGAPARKKKQPKTPMFRNPHKEPIPNKNTLPVPVPAARVASPAPPAPKPPPKVNKESTAAMRKRLIHCLAVAERSSEEVVRLVVGSDPDPTSKRDLLSLLEEVADKPTKNGNKLSKWKLKSESWLDVRPYEWPKLTEAERTSMIHTARKAFTTLGIPNGDPAWDHVRMRPASSQSVSSNASGPIAARTASQNGQAGPSDVSKRSAPSADIIKKKSKSKPEAPLALARDERVPSVSKSNGKERYAEDRPSPSPSLSNKSLAAVRRPGSGYRLPKTASHDSHSERGDSPAPPPIPRPRPPVDVQRKERDMPSSLPAKPGPSVPPPERKLNGSTSMQSVKRKQESQLASDVERERPRKDVDRARVRERDRDRVRERDSDWEMDWETTERQTRDPEKPRNKLDVSSGSLKRKKVPRDADEQEYLPSRTSSIKRQKLDITERGSSSLREESVVKKMPMAQKAEAATSSPRPKPTRVDPSPAPEPRIRREVSPPPPRRQSDLPTKAASSSRPNKQRGSPAPKHLSSNKNHRRRSPIYTTTEDEADEPSPKPDKPVLPTPPKTVRPSHHSSHTSARSQARPLPSDHASLRARYSQCYRRYLITFEKILAQKDKIENMLTKDGSVGSLTDADSDGELMDTDDLGKLMAEHRRQHEELASMRQVFAKAESG
ncbi:hypothetical protein PC9H_007565 [Pleurotus ostreatus]|uniref:RNA polymerase II elongation factor ELL N-terminal domain-containing protein n=1 Tax=Pleurotus ostreatus TaxID=5322 RepID=A0A8H7DRT4_PLEOS|nr:uncharacterized protein PC9H_007565 [Pleurotus ostreatus]KAF7428344.1 hypothetical protein PC9H_007565 [Pleurotus ostreatus]KAJ8696460.1 hypothetical protein PTI98_006327 [Pleurotus ostreatus]